LQLDDHRQRTQRCDGYRVVDIREFLGCSSTAFRTLAVGAASRLSRRTTPFPMAVVPCWFAQLNGFVRGTVVMGMRMGVGMRMRVRVGVGVCRIWIP